MAESEVAEASAAHGWEVITHVIVMLHATTEDAARTVARVRLPSRDLKSLAKIPISPPSSKSNDPKGLAVLAPYHDFTVAQLVQSSIDVWLDTQSFGTSDRIVEMWNLLDLPLDPIRPFFSSINAVARLRHDIAHTGDIQQQHIDKLRDGEAIYGFIQSAYLFLRTAVLQVTPPDHFDFVALTINVHEAENRFRGLTVPRFE